jgi:hypothetical protein
MIMSVSTLRMGSGAATPVSVVNFSIVSLFGAFQVLRPSASARK